MDIPPKNSSIVSKWTTFALFCCSLCSLLGPHLLVAGIAAGQEQQPLPEIPLTFRPPFSARYAGMGGAMIALADDHSAAAANPATLGLIRQIEFGVGFINQDASRDVTYRRTTSGVDYGKTRLADLGFAYPFPTYRGSLVVGAAYERVSPLDSDFMKVGAGGGILREEEDIFQSGGLGAYSASIGFQPTDNLFLGGSGTILHGSNSFDRIFKLQSTVLPDTSYEQMQDYDISGITGSLGALLKLESGVRLGIVLHLPEGLDFDGTVIETDLPTAETAIFDISEHIYLPYRLGVGLAIARPHLVLAVDAIYADWSQIEYFGELRLIRPRQAAYRQTVQLRAGGEVLLSTTLPVRIRAGYDLEPIPYDVVLIENIDVQPYEPARFVRDRHYFTFGAGVLLAESLTLDVAYMIGGFERGGRTTSNREFFEKEKDRRLLGSLSVRLPFGRD